MRHKEWRKIAKNMRRKKIRQIEARKRDNILDKAKQLRENSPTFQIWQSDQKTLELFKIIEEKRINVEANEKWLQEEVRAQLKWRELLEKIARAKEEKVKQDLRIKQEWDEKERKQKLIEDEKIRIQEEKRIKYDKLMQQIDDYINQGGDMPAEMDVPFETNPTKPLCPFFSKTGACRFGDRCSRNHPRPGFSRVLLVPNFYTHFGMAQSGHSEYGSDLLLEYEDSETYDHFKEFFYDVLPEFQKFGNVIQFKVCCNSEPHLRGNVYIEYHSERNAVGAYQSFQGRWYGGRQLNVEFSALKSWRSAICGMFFKQTCPKGRSCNFLHVFRNPRNLFRLADRDQHRKVPTRLRDRSRSSSLDSRDKDQTWRWSESPEPVLKYKDREEIEKSGHRLAKRESSRRQESRHRSSSKTHEKSYKSRGKRPRSRSRNSSNSMKNRRNKRSRRSDNSHKKLT